MNKTRRDSAGRERGAALIVAVGVLALLLVIALTFFRASIGDVKTAQNTVDGVRAELMADGATAVAEAFLNHDRAMHPTFNSLDGAWKVYFNGTFFMGKPYMWAELQDDSLPSSDPNFVHRLSPLRKGIPEIDPQRIFPQYPTDGMYIPRVDYTFGAGVGLGQGNLPGNLRTVGDDGLDNDGDGQTDEAGEIRNPFVTTSDLAVPGNAAKFPPIESMFLAVNALLAGQGFPPIATQADFAALETAVYDKIANVASPIDHRRILSLRTTPNLTGANNETLPYEQVHFWNDVDNDGDGLLDSMWLPVGADRYYPDDGLDNDLDGFIDADDPDGEPGVFMYRGDTDGLDNDGDGVVDEFDPDNPYDPSGEYQYVIFTVPLPFWGQTDTDPALDVVVPSAAERLAMGITDQDIVRFEGEISPTLGTYDVPIGYGRSGNQIYTRDNDYDLVADEPVDASHYMFTPAAVQAMIDGTYPYLELLRQIYGTDPNPNSPTFGNSMIDTWLAAGAPGYPVPQAAIDTIDNDGDGEIDEADEARFIIRGETMTELVGRMAILIKDESSKVNINAAGGWDYPVFPDPLNPPANGPLLGLGQNPALEPSTATTPFQRAFADGVGPQEFDLRVIPDIGASRARWMWQYNMGAREGFYAQNLRDPSSTPPFDVYTLSYPYSAQYEGDVTLPGLGFVDDNANMLQLALDGINNHGGPSYLVDPADLNDPTKIIDPRVDRGLLGGKWEGIDEPGEYQRFRPLRNLVAEGIAAPDNRDDDGDDALNEIGEMGDQYYRTHQQLKLINAGTFNNGGFSGVRGLNDENVFNDLRGYFTAYSDDRNERHFHQDSVLSDFQLTMRRESTGMRKDLNVTRPQDVAKAISRDWTFPASGPEQWTVVNGALQQRAAVLDFGEDTTVAGRTADFLRGLRQENMTVSTSQPILGLADSSAEDLAFTMLADSELRAHQEAATLKDYADLDYTRSVDDTIFTPDVWWSSLATAAAQGDASLAAAAAIARTQRIYYTEAGLEAIRINELNVRPVRRIEAEATTLETETTPDPNVDFNFKRGLDPNRFVPHNGAFPPATQPDAEVIEEQGFRIRRTTTASAIDAYNAREGDNVSIAAADAGSDWALESLTNLLGIESAWATYRRYVRVTGTNPDREFLVPDVLELSIQATDEVPPGRYYLTINTDWVDADGNVQPSVGSQADFLFAVKTGTLQQDWFADVMNIDAYVRGNDVYNQAWRNPALLGTPAMGGSDGMAFLQGDAVFRFDPALPAGSVFTTTRPGFLLNNLLDRNLGFTIEVPARDTSLDPEDDRWVHIAIRSMRRAPNGVDNGFVVNYLELSQEPDHEWVEVTNTSNDIVDLSGWQVAVEGSPIGIGPMTVPDGTLIAPGAMLLLGTNKFDYAFNIDETTGNPVIAGDISSAADPDLFDRGVGFFSNGIGLIVEDAAATPGAGIFFGITVPQTSYDTGDPQQGSVFYRPNAAPVDFVDMDGDGLEDPVPTLPAVRPDDEVTSTVDPLLIFPAPQAADKAWDRIVELIIPDLVAQNPQTDFTAADVGRIVLGGGIFPNRPEYDLTDNDGDNRILAFDGIDNDGDGFIDGDDPFEGVNEGRFARDQRLRELVTGAALTPIPGGFNAGTVPFRSRFFDFGLGEPDGVPDYLSGEPVTGNPLLMVNPPQWKEFVERRNFPGDDVIVTLYEGPATAGRVADRVTYTQRDVENRQIDDVLLVTDFDTNRNTVLPGGQQFGDAALTDAGVPLPLDDNYPSFWPENTMGIDFARSLERKHPDYTGDRFGTQNRFQATDGSYDDWSDSTGRWERGFQFAGGTGQDFGTLQDVVLIDRMGDAAFEHAFNGTPLRRNIAARIAEDPVFSQFNIATNPIPAARGTTFALGTFRNRPLVSPGDGLTMPHTSRHETFRAESGPPPVLPSTNIERYVLDMSSPNIEFFQGDVVGRGDLSYDSVILGQRFDNSPTPINFFHDVRALIGDVGTTDSVSLNVGQASVIQVARPSDSNPPSGYSPGESWNVATGRPPQAWAPLMTFSLADDASPAIATPPPFGFAAYGYDRQYLFQPPTSTSLPTTVDNLRWPRELRTAVYASRNFGPPNTNSFDAGDPLDGAEAVFVWDGDDGLENGEYDVYVVTTEDLSLLARADDQLFTNSATRLLTGPSTTPTGIGRPFVFATDQTANNELFFDIEVFRDSNGDRKAWAPNLVQGEFLLDSQLQRGGVGIPAESFGIIRGAQPNPDGIIHYGVVRVENNFLAMMIRNRSAAGNVARISRVILSARNKTPGRININTVETTRISLRDATDSTDLSDSDQRHFYNPLTGLPGVLQRPLDSDAIGPITTLADQAGFDLTNVEPAQNDDFAQSIARHIVEQRLRLLNERPDGRYYELTSDLLADAHFASVTTMPGTPATPADPLLRPPLVAEYDNLLRDRLASGLDAIDNTVASDEVRADAIAEMAYRFRKMQNLITTKGESFEILVTVQAGYGTDKNGDGRINWRDDNEFTARAEKTARTIYER